MPAFRDFLVLLLNELSKIVNICPILPAPRPLLRSPGFAATLLLAAILLPLGGSAGAATPSAPTRLQDQADPYAGIYLGLGWAGGDDSDAYGGFEGGSFVAWEDVVVVKSGFEPGSGFTVECLGRAGAGGLALSYTRIAYDGHWRDAPGEAVSSAADMDLRLFLLHRRPLQLYGNAGLGFKWLVVREFDALDQEVSDAKFTDLGWNLGAGVLLFPTDRLMLECGMTWQAIDYTAVAPPGRNDWDSIEGGFTRGVTAFHVSLLFNFWTSD